MSTQKQPSKELPASSQRKDVKKLSVEAMKVYSGPIPPASELEKYEKIQPGLADRILTMAERQSTHRQKQESKALDHGIKLENRGQWLGFTICGIVIILGFFLTMSDKNTAGLTAMLAPLATIIGLFIYKHHSSNKKQ